MDATEAAEPSAPGKPEKKYLTVRQAAFIGVGAMALLMAWWGRRAFAKAREGGA